MAEYAELQVSISLSSSLRALGLVGILSSVVKSVKGERSSRKRAEEREARPPVQHRKSWMQSLNNLSQVFHADDQLHPPEADAPKRGRFPSLASFSSKGESVRSRGDSSLSPAKDRSLAARVRPISVSLGFSGHKRGSSSATAGSGHDSYTPSPLHEGAPHVPQAQAPMLSSPIQASPMVTPSASTGTAHDEKPVRPSTAPAGVRNESQMETSALAARMNKLRGMEEDTAVRVSNASAATSQSTTTPNHLSRPTILDRTPSSDSASVYTQSTAQDDHTPSANSGEGGQPPRLRFSCERISAPNAKRSMETTESHAQVPTNGSQPPTVNSQPPTRDFLSMSTQDFLSAPSTMGKARAATLNGDHGKDFIAVDIPMESPFAGWKF
ncbi:uncharacterized protein SCHCODRAFT_02702568 [Schizophyllum commune H4-8]|nr:uncharacterized protein SCHCODRAFT_02702568 [Schizophyllum commune H4-8]KAI5889853.1 hypothetical protein SCHCODRAFT_02702568 [Schizophyllum commune H4-8]